MDKLRELLHTVHYELLNAALQYNLLGGWETLLAAPGIPTVHPYEVERVLLP